MLTHIFRYGQKKWPLIWAPDEENRACRFWGIDEIPFIPFRNYSLSLFNELANDEDVHLTLSSLVESNTLVYFVLQ